MITRRVLLTMLAVALVSSVLTAFITIVLLSRVTLPYLRVHTIDAQAYYLSNAQGRGRAAWSSPDDQLTVFQLWSEERPGEVQPSIQLIASGQRDTHIRVYARGEQWVFPPLPER
jgi:hypothetical protein